MSKAALLIYNPRAGTGQVAQKLNDIVCALTKEGMRLEVFPTNGSGSAHEKIMSLDSDYEAIIASGGDGTMNEVVAGVVERGLDVAVGYIPAGSTNDFAASLDLPSNMLSSAQLILNKNERRIDVGLMNDRPFIYVAAFGAFTKVAYATDQTLKNIFGHAAYILSGIGSIAEIRPYHLELEIDGKGVGGNYILGMITNSVSVGGIKNITGKHVALEDGLFEVTLVREPKGIVEVQEIVAALLTGREDSYMLDIFKASDIKIKCEEEVPWTLDGEFGGNTGDVHIKILNKALRIYT